MEHRAAADFSAEQLLAFLTPPRNLDNNFPRVLGPNPAVFKGTIEPFLDKDAQLVHSVMVFIYHVFSSIDSVS
jgi:hypothetical protein